MIDYLNDNLWQAWALLSVACIVLELFSGSFFIVCFAIGGLAALVASLFCGFYAQLTVFAVASAVSIFLVRPFAIRYIHLNREPVPSNADAITLSTTIAASSNTTPSTANHHQHLVPK